MIIILQILIYLVLFSAAVKAVAGNNPVGCVFFYPKPVQQRVYDLGLTTPEIIRRRKTIFFTVLLTGVPVLPVIFISVWNGITDFLTAYVQALLFFLIIKGTEDLQYVKSIKFVVIERVIMTLVYIPVAAIVAGIAVFLVLRKG